MQKQTVVLLVGALLLLCAGGLFVPQLLADPEIPVVRWTAQDEVEVAEEPADPAGAGDEANGGLDRTAVELSEGDATRRDERVEVILRGRVVDKFHTPVADANVWLDFGRGGPRGGAQNRQRRVPDPVLTDREGRFAFQGQAFRNLRVSLQVKHRTHALGLFEKDVGDVGVEVELGDLVLTQGGELRGRVTDLDGNGVVGAVVQLNPENGNRLRTLRDRERMLENFTTDGNGSFRGLNLPSGDWSVTATAKMHTEGRSPTFVMEEDQLVEIEDIRLGPGYEVTGYVRSLPGQPIAKATVVLQSENRNRNGGGRGPGGGGPGGGGPGGGPGGGWQGGGPGGRDHRATTDEQGRFFLEHLPGGPMRLEASADGYLDFQQSAVDPTLGQPIYVTLQDGLRITGTVRDTDGSPVTMFAVRALRVRGLPQPGQGSANVNDLIARVREGNIDEATRTQIRGQIEALRDSMGGSGDRRPGRGGPQGQGDRNGENSGGRPGNGRDLGRPERHLGGTFVATGLQEGIYEVAVQSPNHARYRSAELELRLGAVPPDLVIALDPGVFVAGAVLDEAGAPVRNARVELRAATADEISPRRRGRGNGADPAGNGLDLEAMGREFMQKAAGVQTTLEATTDAEGVFVIKHAQRGSYRLRAEARGFATVTGEPFDLQTDRSGFELRLGALGSIAGNVRGLREGEFQQARVAAVPVGSGQGGGLGALFGRGRGGGNGGGGGQGGGGGGNWNGVSVGPDGTYRIEGLVPGTYVVRGFLGSPQELMRELGPQFLDGSLVADVTVRKAEVATLDVTVTRPQVGIVAGTVLHNGTPATGFQIELVRQDETGATANNNPIGGRGPGGGGGPGGRGAMFGGFGRSFQGAVAQSGRFSIADVPAGNYRLRVQAGRRGGLLHEEILQVNADTTTERNLVLQTQNLQGTVTRDDGGNPAELNGRVSLLPGLTELPENLNNWQRENTTFDARLQNGTFRFETLKPGNYLLVLTVRGRERTTTTLVVGGADQSVVVAAGKVAAATSPIVVPNRTNRPANGIPR